MNCESCGTQLPWAFGPKRCRDCDNDTRELTEVDSLRAKLAAAEAAHVRMTNVLMACQHERDSYRDERDTARAEAERVSNALALEIVKTGRALTERDRALDDLAAAEAEKAALREAFARYARHDDDCDRPTPGRCRCGYAAAERERDTARAEVVATKTLADEWRVAYEGSEHGQLEREWQAEREDGAKNDERLERELVEARAQIKALTSWEPCPKCGYGVTGECYGCKLKARDEALATARAEVVRLQRYNAAYRGKGLADPAVVELVDGPTAARAEVSMLRSQLRAAEDRAQMRSDESDQAHAEAARLRGLVREAFDEGQNSAATDLRTSMKWDDSDAKSALEGDHD